MAVVAGGSKMNLVEAYTDGEDSDVEYGQHRYLAQTFTLDDDYTVWRFRLKSWTQTGGEVYHYAIRNVDGAGKPVGEDIYHTTLSPTGEVFYSPGKWRRFDFDAFPALPAGTYAIVASVPDASGWQWYQLRCDASAPAYAGGKAWRSLNDGVDWEEIPGTDFMFEVWGYQPPPETPPTPVISNWAPLDLEYTYVLDGYELVVTTDIPCHLFMRWTTTKPLTHPLTEYRRGIIIQIGTRYCFVTWRENEQTEPGDTLTHTFIKKNWPVCQTRYFYFIGTKQAEEQPSSSAIFVKHRLRPAEPTIKQVFFPLENNRTLRSNSVGWGACWGGSSLEILPSWDPPDSRLISAAVLTASYFISRSFLTYDTTPIPATAIIQSATLKPWFFVKYITSSVLYPYWQITPGHQSDPIETDDWDAQNPETTILGQIDIRDIILNQFNDIPLNAEGLTHINKGGLTKYCNRIELDIRNIPPPLGANAAWYHSAQKGASFWPLLEVNYWPD